MMRRTLVGTSVCLVLWMASGGTVRAQGEGLFITVNNPITDKEMTRVKEVTDAAIRRFKELHNDAPPGAPIPRLNIVYDFNPDNKEASTVLYGSCWQLADYILSLADVNTIAFVHGRVTGHSVLPVLACHEIVMASGAQLGDVLRDPTATLPVDVDQFYNHPIVVSYRNVAERRGRSPAIVLKMLSPSMEVHEGARAGSVVYLDSRFENKDPAVKVSRRAVLPRGRTEPYSVDEAIRFGLCNLKKDSRQEVAQAYQLPPASLREDPLQGRVPVPFHIIVRGPLTPSFQETIQRRISRAVGQGANFVILELECGGGDISVASDLARVIRDLRDTTGQHPVLTIAYVTEHARDNAAYLALACTHIVMHPRARLGDFERYLEANPTFAGADGAIGKRLVELAQEGFYPTLLVKGMVDPDLTIYRARRAKGVAERRFITEQELKESKGEWQDEGLVKPKGQLLTLDATRAKELGFSRYTADNFDQLLQHFNLEPATVRDMGPDWLENFAGFLRHPMMAVILIMTGITCLVLELKLPGVGIPGVISALCFILFFWAHWNLAFTWLAALLFVLGLVLLGIEIFVTPGFGFLGVSGILMVLGGLGLATLERWPQTESEWASTVAQTGVLGGALVGAVVVALVVGRYLPSIPYANRLMLVPPGESSESLVGDSGDTGDLRFAALLGAMGVAATPLRPAGTVRIGDDYIDVVAEGSYVEAGSRVQVVEVEAHRIVVKEV